MLIALAAVVPRLKQMLSVSGLSSEVVIDISSLGQPPESLLRAVHYSRWHLQGYNYLVGINVWCFSERLLDLV